MARIFWTGRHDVGRPLKQSLVFFAAMMTLQLVTVWLVCAEAKDVTLDEMERKLAAAAG